MTSSVASSGRGSFQSAFARQGSFMPSEINVGDVERWASVVGGGAIVVGGLARGSLGGLALALLGGGLIYRGVTGHCHLYGAFGLNTAQGTHSPASSIPAGHGFKVDVAMTINRPPEELYRFWVNLENLPRFMKHLKSVEVTGGNRSHWVATAPAGLSAEWDAEVINQRPNAMIAWRSLPGSEVDTAGSVHFDPAAGGRGTVVRVTLKYDPPGGKVTAALAGLMGEDAEQQIRQDLQRFKQLMEAREVPSAQGHSAGQAR